MSESLGDTAQVRMIAEQIGSAAADMAVRKYAMEHPPAAPKPEIPAPLKVAGAIVLTLLTTGVGGTLVWAMTTINEMQVTVARIDERMETEAGAESDRDDEINRRLTRLEQMAGEAR